MDAAEFGGCGVVYGGQWTISAVATRAGGVEVTHESGFEFVTIHPSADPGIPFHSPSQETPFDYYGRGTVSQSYRIARTEVSSGQWMAFFNSFSGQEVPQVLRTTISGSFQNGLTFSGIRPGLRFGPGRVALFSLRDVPNAAQLPAADVSWRLAACYCNWLHNGMSSDINSLLTGAYDTSTWSPIGAQTVTDQTSHLPGARYFIPTLDQWFRAAYFDPNRHGPGQAGWWSRVNAQVTIPVSGYPGEVDGEGRAAETTFGRNDPQWPIYNWNAWDVPLGAFPNMQSPWGLLDTIGGGSEWTEEVQPGVTSGAIGAAGLSATSSLGPNSEYPLLDYGSQFWWVSYPSPWGSDQTSLRIAAAVPSPGSMLVSVCIWPIVIRRKQRRFS